MKHSRYKELLIESAEGTIAAVDKSTLDAHLTGCADCRSELKLIVGVFSRLENVPEEKNPDGYFESIAPHVWKNIDEGGKKLRGTFFPPALQRCIMPLAASFVLAAMTGLFYLLQPPDGVKAGSLQSIVLNAEKDELLFLAEVMGNPALTARLADLVDAVPNPSALPESMDHQLVSGEIEYRSPVGQNVLVTDLLEEYSDEEITDVLNRLRNGTAL